MIYVPIVPQDPRGNLGLSDGADADGASDMMARALQKDLPVHITKECKMDRAIRSVVIGITLMCWHSHAEAPFDVQTQATELMVDKVTALLSEKKFAIPRDILRQFQPPHLRDAELNPGPWIDEVNVHGRNFRSRTLSVLFKSGDQICIIDASAADSYYVTENSAENPRPPNSEVRPQAERDLFRKGAAAWAEMSCLTGPR